MRINHRNIESYVKSIVMPIEDELSKLHSKTIRIQCETGFISRNGVRSYTNGTPFIEILEISYGDRGVKTIGESDIQFLTYISNDGNIHVDYDSISQLAFDMFSQLESIFHSFDSSQISFQNLQNDPRYNGPIFRDIFENDQSVPGPYHNRRISVKQSNESHLPHINVSPKFHYSDDGTVSFYIRSQVVPSTYIFEIPESKARKIGRKMRIVGEVEYTDDEIREYENEQVQIHKEDYLEIVQGYFQEIGFDKMINNRSLNVLHDINIREYVNNQVIQPRVSIRHLDYEKRTIDSVIQIQENFVESDILNGIIEGFLYSLPDIEGPLEEVNSRKILRPRPHLSRPYTRYSNNPIRPYRGGKPPRR